MELSKQNVLYISRSTQQAGTENVVLQLCKIFHQSVNKIVLISAGGYDSKVLKSYGIKHYRIPDIEKKSPVVMMKIARTIKNVVEREDITVIHTHHRMAAFYIRLLGLDKKRYFINTSHNTFYNKKSLTRFAYKNCNLIACGEMVKKNLVSEFGLRKVKVIHNAVEDFNDEIVIEPEFEIAKKQGKYLVGNIGRFSEQKGMKYYLRAIPIVMENHPEAKFYLIGDGEEKADLECFCKELKIEPVFMGFRKDIRNLMSQLDLIVLSSLWEGLPLTPIEAFSVGKTIVATGVDGTLEIVKDKENGLLVESKAVKQLAEKINWMIEHPEEQRRMEVKARETFMKEFSFDILAQSYTDFYRSL